MNRPYVDHIGIIVENLDQCVSLFEHLFDLKPTQIKEMPDVGFRVAHLQAQNIEIELIQYTGDEESFGKKVMGEERGLNHLSLRVDDLKASLKHSEGKGPKVMDGFPRPGSHGQIAFFDPDTTEGLLLEICERIVS